ncbi:TetR/AcrR family transcriptional regulator [Streptomyces aurantiogriseus]|uniref:TetR family transcriptional regulator n=1 Tax=Streptomyces aurantiogriseus TaxID=66870 RepID=A0A918KXY3_9ACTN|nr:TetR/AcrR family transcriptional regulator [Streptomyces aurantiogriseus]GGR41777.1 TetR family transcriptional regulator [Streptomyces aurantiogriseus]
MATTDSTTRGEQTRARLFDAAVQLIAEEGWGAVTTRKIADRAGVRAGVVHYHFATVTDLLVDAALDATRRELGRGLELLREAEDVSTGLRHVLRAVAEYAADEPMTALLSETLLAARRIGRLREELSALLRELRAVTAQWLRSQGCAEEPEATAIVLLAALDGLMLHLLLDPDLPAASLAGPLARLAGQAEPQAPSTGTVGTADA